MDFNTYFRASSYAMIAVAMLALTVAGGLNYILAIAFAALMVVSWNLEGRRWQLSERTGLVIVVFSIPLFFLDWKFQKALGEPAGRLGVNALAHLIAFLSAIKLLQVKSDRDWVFLYLISFFEVLLAAGLSFSPAFLGTLSLYLLCALSTVIAFEIRKATRAVKLVETRLLVPPDSSAFKRMAKRRRKTNVEANRLPMTALVLLVFIFLLAFPLFLVAPRAGSPIISRADGGLSGFIGFSESVALGEIGTLKRNDQVVMRVRLEDNQAGKIKRLRWRGVALDQFTGRSWRKSAAAKVTQHKTSERGSFRIGTTEAPHRLVMQTVFLEPIDSGVIFAAPQPVLVQGDFPFLRVDEEGSIQFRPHESDRFIYKALSDVSEPDADELRGDRRPYSSAFERYRELPENLDPRIASLARDIVVNARARNRYDAAVAIESELRNNYGYSLDRKASGEDPLADFLFNVKRGHCEYFSTAMAVMLRTVGIASRVVNGFLPGEYNEAADAYTVRQSDAHSWVEVYFPESNSWVTFDPTPAAGQGSASHTGVAATLSKYAEALELIWFQYVVGYDQQEQRSLATTLHNQLFQYQRVLSDGFNSLKQASLTSWQAPLLTVLGLLLLPPLIFLLVRLKRFGWRGFWRSGKRKQMEGSSVEFYERLTKLLAERGLTRSSDQTPLEFAAETGMDSTMRITEAYHRVRYGSAVLSRQEAKEIDNWLSEMEAAQQSKQV
jgi:protein-glutamine gamma-glutamyltransferase